MTSSPDSAENGVVMLRHWCWELRLLGTPSSDSTGMSCGMRPCARLASPCVPAPAHPPGDGSDQAACSSEGCEHQINLQHNKGHPWDKNVTGHAHLHQDNGTIWARAGRGLQNSIGTGRASRQRVRAKHTACREAVPRGSSTPLRLALFMRPVGLTRMSALRCESSSILMKSCSAGEGGAKQID